MEYIRVFLAFKLIMTNIVIAECGSFFVPVDSIILIACKGRNGNTPENLLMKKRKVVLTGGTGFIMFYVTERYAELGDDLVLFDNNE
jgi:hypothetical protein